MHIETKSCYIHWQNGQAQHQADTSFQTSRGFSYNPCWDDWIFGSLPLLVSFCQMCEVWLFGSSNILALVRMLNPHSSSLRLGAVGVCYDLTLPGETLVPILTHQSRAWINAFTVSYPGISRRHILPNDASFCT